MFEVIEFSKSAKLQFKKYFNLKLFQKVYIERLQK